MFCEKEYGVSTNPSLHHRIIFLGQKLRLAAALLNVTHVKEVMSRSNAFDHLVLEPELKAIVEGLSRSYSRRKRLEQMPVTTDFIRGKGEGQVFLLHGPP